MIRLLRKNKKADMQISFNFIFSLILIIAFVTVAVYGIMFFLNMQKCVNTGMFQQDLQSKVENYWQRTGVEISQTLEIPLARDIDSICFIDFNRKAGEGLENIYEEFEYLSYSKKENVFFYPSEKACSNQFGFELEKINITRITQEQNPYCIKNENGKIKTNIVKNSRGDVLVCLGEFC